MAIGRRLQEDEFNKLQAAFQRAKAQEIVQPVLPKIIRKFNEAFMKVLPEWEFEIERSYLPEYMHSRGWNRRCASLVRTIINADTQLAETCKDISAELIVEMMDLPS